MLILHFSSHKRSSRILRQKENIFSPFFFLGANIYSPRPRQEAASRTSSQYGCFQSVSVRYSSSQPLRFTSRCFRSPSTMSSLPNPDMPPSKIRKRLREALLEASNLTLYNPIQWKIQQSHAENTHDKLLCKWKTSSGRRRPLDPIAVGFAGVTGADRHEVWLRDGAVRSVHGASRRKGHSILRCAAIARGRKACDDHRRTIRESHASAAKSLD